MDEEKSELKQIRTFQGDVVEALKKQNESLYSIRQKEGPVYQESETGIKKILPLAAGGLVLMALALGIGYRAYGEYVRKTTPPTPTIPESRFISAENSVNLDISNLSPREILETIESKTARGLNHLVVKENLDQFLNKINANPPGSLIRALDPIFMLGTLGQSPFIILRVSSYENAFAGMLAWEKNFLEDFQTSSVFRDVASRNKDVRALYASTTPAILYSFFENRWIIVTDNFETLHGLIDRLTRQLLIH